MLDAVALSLGCSPALIFAPYNAAGTGMGYLNESVFGNYYFIRKINNSYSFDMSALREALAVEAAAGINALSPN